MLPQKFKRGYSVRKEGKVGFTVFLDCSFEFFRNCWFYNEKCFNLNGISAHFAVKWCWCPGLLSPAAGFFCATGKAAPGELSIQSMLSLWRVLKTI